MTDLSRKSRRAVLILGGGGHAKVVLDAVLAMGLHVAGFLDRNPDIEDLFGIKRLGDADPATFTGFGPSEVILANGFGYVGEGTLRMKQYDLWKGLGYQFLALQHPTAVIGRAIELKEGAQILAGAILQPGVSIGENAIINTGATIDHDCFIGKHAHVATGAVLAGGVKVGEGTHVGAAATVIQNIRVGRGSLIGAGSVVVRDVPDYMRVMGVPAHHNMRSNGNRRM